MLKKILKSALLLTCLIGLLVTVTSDIFAAGKKKTDKIELSKKTVKMKVDDEIIIGYEKNADVRVKVTTSKKDDGFGVSVASDKNIKIENLDENNIKITAIKSGTVKVKIVLSSNKKVARTLKIKISDKEDFVYGEIVKVTGKNFEKEVLQAKGKVIVDYSAKWCGYCQMLEPIYEEAAKIRQLYKFTRVDADEEADFVLEQGVFGLPTLQLYENGKLTKVGGYKKNMTVWDFIDWIER